MVANKKTSSFLTYLNQCFLCLEFNWLLVFSCLLLSSHNITQRKRVWNNFEQARQKRFLIGSSSCFKDSPFSKHRRKDSAILLSISVVANLSRAHNLTKTAYIIKKIYETVSTKQKKGAGNSYQKVKRQVDVDKHNAYITFTALVSQWYVFWINSLRGKRSPGP